MKKIIPLFTILFATLMLSGCFFIVPDDWAITSQRKYSITCNNTSDTATITDWCVVKDNSVTYARSQTQNCNIAPGAHATLNNLPYGNYILYVSWADHPYYNSSSDTNYSRTNTFTLNENKTFNIGDPVY